jgi:hypothetical protein
MTQRDADNDVIRAALGELRAVDERNAPPFHSTMTRSPRAPGPRTLFVRVAFAAAIIIAAAGVYRAVEGRRARLAIPADVLALASWRAPSDVLLETPATNLLRYAPQLGGSLIDTTIQGDLP